MKNLKRFWIIILLMVSCNETDEFVVPMPNDLEPSIEGNLTTIATVKGHYDFETDVIYNFRDSNAYFSGYVISSDEGGNFYKKLILQDRASNPTAGIQILIDDTALFDTYNFGRKVYIKLDGLSLGFSNGVLQLGIQNRGDIVPIPQALIDRHVIRSGETVTITPLNLEISEFQEKHKNLFIRLNNVQFDRNLIRDDQRFSFSAESIDQFDGERQIESCRDGATTVLSTSTFSDFRSLLLPASIGAIDGVLTRNFYDDFYVIIVNSPEDLNFEGDQRCDPEYLNCGENATPGTEDIFQESFETITTVRMLETRGWVNVNVSGGSKRYEPGTQAGNRHVRITAYNTLEVPLEAWLVTPAIDISKVIAPVLSLDLRSSFDNATILRVYATSNFTGNPQTTNWELLDVVIPVGPSNQNATTFTRSHIDLSCLSEMIHIGFRYLGSAPDKSTTYDIDNVRVTGK